MSAPAFDVQEIAVAKILAPHVVRGAPGALRCRSVLSKPSPAFDRQCYGRPPCLRPHRITKAATCGGSALIIGGRKMGIFPTALPPITFAPAAAAPAARAHLLRAGR